MVLSLLGVAVSLIAANVIRRHQIYYRHYIARARAIEAQLTLDDEPVMSLYTGGKIAAAGSCSVSSKTAIIVLFWIFAVIFLMSSVILGYSAYADDA